jgi:hypothetical protein
MSDLYDRVKVNIPTTGTGNVTFGGAIAGFCTPTEAGAVDGKVPRYIIVDDFNFEEGEGLIFGGGAQMQRVTVTRSKIGGVVGTSKINLSGAAILAFTASAADILNPAANLNDLPDKAAARTNLSVPLASDVTAALANRVRVDTAQSFTAGERAQGLSNLGIGLRGHIAGLTLSNNASDATNDLDIAAGEARDDTNVDTIVFASAVTGAQLDALFGVGNGIRDTGSLVDGTWHVYGIKNPTSGDTKPLASLSATAPTMPAGYTLKRRIGSIIRASGAIYGFVQHGDTFYHKRKRVDVSGAFSTTAQLVEVSVPAGLKVVALLSDAISNSDTNNHSVLITSPDETDEEPTATVFTVRSMLNTTITSQLAVLTNNARQIRLRCDSTLLTHNLTTRGWIDRRGRDD